MLNWLLRYKPVIDTVEELDPKTILDVGSGRHGLSWYTDRKVVQTDLEFPRVEVGTTRSGSADFVAARAEALPFASCSFDVVVALDLVEHLPQSIREPAVKEMCRVARRAIIVGYPDGDDARRLDRFLARVWKLRSRTDPPGWLVEHLDQEIYPDRSTLERFLPDGWAITSERRSGNLLFQGLVVSLEWTPVNRVLRVVERWLRNHKVPALVDRGRTYRGIWTLEPTSGA